MLQVLNYMFRNPGNDNVKVNLLYANQSECCEKNENEKRAFKNLLYPFVWQHFNQQTASTNTIVRLRSFLFYSLLAEDDILVREELEALLKDFPDQFNLHYTVDTPPADGWKHSTGFISKDMIQEFCLFSGSSKDTQVFMCGPPPMIKFACLPNLKELGFTDKDWFSF